MSEGWGEGEITNLCFFKSSLGTFLQTGVIFEGASGLLLASGVSGDPQRNY